MRLTREMIQVDHKFSTDEKLDLLNALTSLLQKKDEAEGDLKAFSAEKKGEIQGCITQINQLTTKIQRGGEFRPTMCRIVYAWDSKTKFWISEKDDVIVKDDIISESELQEQLELEAKKTADSNLNVLWEEDMLTKSSEKHISVERAFENFTTRKDFFTAWESAAASHFDSPKFIERSLPGGFFARKEKSTDKWSLLKKPPEKLSSPPFCSLPSGKPLEVVPSLTAPSTTVLVSEKALIGTNISTSIANSQDTGPSNPAPVNRASVVQVSPIPHKL